MFQKLLFGKVKRTSRIEYGLYVMDQKTKPQQDKVKIMFVTKKGNEGLKLRDKRLRHAPMVFLEK